MVLAVELNLDLHCRTTFLGQASCWLQLCRQKILALFDFRTTLQLPTKARSFSARGAQEIQKQIGLIAHHLLLRVIGPVVRKIGAKSP